MKRWIAAAAIIVSTVRYSRTHKISTKEFLPRGCALPPMKKLIGHFRIWQPFFVSAVGIFIVSFLCLPLFKFGSKKQQTQQKCITMNDEFEKEMICITVIGGTWWSTRFRIYRENLRIMNPSRKSRNATAAKKRWCRTSTHLAISVLCVILCRAP